MVPFIIACVQSSPARARRWRIARRPLNFEKNAGTSQQLANMVDLEAQTK